jgi:hypothetical protein
MMQTTIEQSKTNAYLRSFADFKPSGRPAYDRFMRYRAKLARKGDLTFNQRGRLTGRTQKQQERFDRLWHQVV